MAFLTHRLFALLICVGLLAMEPRMVHGLGRTHLVHRLSPGHGIAAKKPHMLKNIGVANLNTRKRSTSGSSSFRSTQMSKRRVRRGSDPIHNRSWFSASLLYCRAAMEEGAWTRKCPCVGGETTRFYWFKVSFLFFLSSSGSETEQFVQGWYGKDGVE